MTELCSDLLGESAEDIIAEVIKRAKKGDGVAMRLVVERLVPVRAARDRTIDLGDVPHRVGRLDQLVAAAAAVIDQAANGNVTLSEAREFLALLDGQRKIIETTELAIRLEILEGQLGLSPASQGGEDPEIGARVPANNPSKNNPPSASAGADQVVDAGASVTLDGSASSDPGGKPITFLWKQTAGTEVSLSSASAPIVTFTAPEDGTALVFELTVSNGQSNAVGKVNVSVHPVNPLVQVTEIHQPSIKDDPAVNGHFPDGWVATTFTPAGPLDPDDTGAPEGVEKFQFATPVEITLSPGDAHEVELQIAGSSLLIGSVKWIGTTDSLPVTLSLDSAALATGDDFSLGTDRGGAVVRGQTTVGGRATLSMTNTSGATVKVLMILGAFAN